MKVVLLKKLKKENIAKIAGLASITKGYDADVALVEDRIDVGKYRNLKWIHTSFVGVDVLLTDGIKKSGVIVTNSRGMKTPVPEHAMALVLAFERKLRDAFASQQNRDWNRITGGAPAGERVV